MTGEVLQPVGGGGFGRAQHERVPVFVIEFLSGKEPAEGAEAARDELIHERGFLRHVPVQDDAAFAIEPGGLRHRAGSEGRQPRAVGVLEFQQRTEVAFEKDAAEDVGDMKAGGRREAGEEFGGLLVGKRQQILR